MTIARACQMFQRQRGSLDAVELVLAWLGFSWGAGRAGNPLLNEFGVPSAVFVEHVLGALGIDITPGLASRSSCPEAIWQSARWWHGYYKAARNIELTGAYCVGDRMVPEDVVDEPDTPKRSRARRRGR